jgi:drug/metabolite transporter (DMT)-like permease
MNVASRARLQVLAAAALFSTGGAAIKACALPPWQVAGFRSAIAAAAIPFLVPAARRRWNGKTLLVGVAYAATLVLFALANKTTTSAHAIFLQSTAPLYLLVAGPLLLGERIRRSDLVFMTALAGGLALFFAGTEAPRATATDPDLGNVLATASGLTWAASVSGLRWLARDDARDGAAGGAAISAALAGNVIAALVCIPAAWPLASGTAADWGLLAFLGTCQIGLAYACLTAGVRSVRALEATLLLLLEPVLNPLWTWLVHGEAPGPLAVAGGAVILVATTAHALRPPSADAAPA